MLGIRRLNLSDATLSILDFDLEVGNGAVASSKLRAFESFFLIIPLPAAPCDGPTGGFYFGMHLPRRKKTRPVPGVKPVTPGPRDSVDIYTRCANCVNHSAPCDFLLLVFRTILLAVRFEIIETASYFAGARQLQHISMITHETRLHARPWWSRVSDAAWA